MGTNHRRILFKTWLAAIIVLAVFFSFALADPLPPKEMGIILGVAVLLGLRKTLPAISFSHN